MLTRTAHLKVHPQPAPVQAMSVPPIAYALVIGVGIFAHWPALLTDSIMWDDWLILAWTTQGRLDWLYQFFNNYGVTPLGLVYLPFVAVAPTASTAVQFAKFICLASVLLNAVLVMLISIRVAHGNRVFAIQAGATAAVFPGLSGEGFQMTFLIYSFFVPLFLTGMLLFIETARSPAFRPFMRFAALIALFMSFSLNSLLVFFYALVPAVFYASIVRQPTTPRLLFAAAVRFFLRHLDFFALPLLFWVLKELFMPRLGVYARYNVLHFDWTGIVQAYERFVPDMLRAQLLVPFSMPLAAWCAIAVFAIAVFTAPLFLSRVRRASDSTGRELAILLGLGCVALLGAAFPYYLVGRRSFLAFGYTSRDTVLFPLGLGWVAAALLCSLLQFRWPARTARQNRRVKRLVQRAAIAASCAVLAAQSVANWRNHADWQAHYAYYRSVVEKVVHDKNVAAASVVEVVDRLPGDRTLLIWRYPTSIWTAILSAAFQQTTRLAIPFPPANGTGYTPEEIAQRFRDTEVGFMFGDIDLNGPQSRLAVAPAGVPRNPIVLALAYWRARFLAPAEMPDLLQSLTELESSRRGSQ